MKGPRNGRPEMLRKPKEAERDFEFPNKVHRSCVFCAREIAKPLPHMKKGMTPDPRRNNFYAHCEWHGFDPTYEEDMEMYCADFKWRKT